MSRIEVRLWFYNVSWDGEPPNRDAIIKYIDKTPRIEANRYNSTEREDFLVSPLRRSEKELR